MPAGKKPNQSLPALSKTGHALVSASAGRIGDNVHICLMQLDRLHKKLGPDNTAAVAEELGSLYKCLFMQARDARKLKSLQRAGRAELETRVIDAAQVYQEVVAGCAPILELWGVVFTFEGVRVSRRKARPVKAESAPAAMNREVIDDALYSLVYFVAELLSRTRRQRTESCALKARVELTDEPIGGDATLIFHMEVGCPLPMADPHPLAFTKPAELDTKNDRPSVFSDNLSMVYYAAGLHGGRLLTEDIVNDTGELSGHRFSLSFPQSPAPGAGKTRESTVGEFVIAPSFPLMLRGLLELSPLVDNFLEFYTAYSRK